MGAHVDEEFRSPLLPAREHFQLVAQERPHVRRINPKCVGLLHQGLQRDAVVSAMGLIAVRPIRR